MGLVRLLEVTAGECLGDQVRLVPRVQLVAEVLDVALHGPRSDAEFLRALLRREAACNALQDLAFPLRQGHEIVLLPFDVHHVSPRWEFLSSFLTNRLSYCGVTGG